MAAISIHPSVDHGIRPGNANFAGGTLVCHCAQSPVTVNIKGNVAFNHACGCSKCWKPKGAMFSVVAVVGRDNLKVTSGGQKLITLLLQDPPVSYAEISAQLSIPIGSIGPNRRRYLDQLRRHPALAALIDADR